MVCYLVFLNEQNTLIENLINDVIDMSRCDIHQTDHYCRDGNFGVCVKDSFQICAKVFLTAQFYIAELEKHNFNICLDHLPSFFQPNGGVWYFGKSELMVLVYIHILCKCCNLKLIMVNHYIVLATNAVSQRVYFCECKTSLSVIIKVLFKLPS